MRVWRFVVPALALFSLLGMSVTAASAQDVYVVYSGKDRAFKNQIVGAFPANLKVKQYNADLLALADYSGKQKAATKISRAEVVVIIGDKPMTILKKVKIKSNVLIVRSVKRDVKSTGAMLYVVSSRTDISGLTGIKLQVNSRADMNDERSVKSAKVIVVNENAVTLPEAVSKIAQIFI